MRRPATASPSAAQCPACPTPGEMLLIAGLRGWVQLRSAGEAPHSVIGRAMSRKTSARAAALFVAWLETVEAAGRRPIQVQCPNCGGISNDEQRLIVACGLATSAFDVGVELLEPMLIDGESAMVLARSLNLALADCGWRLPARLGRPAIGHSSPQRTLH